MGSPFTTGTWNGVDGAYYTGMGGSWELIWLGVSIAMCVLALVVGATHEAVSYSREEGRSLGPRATNDNTQMDATTAAAVKDEQAA